MLSAIVFTTLSAAKGTGTVHHYVIPEVFGIIVGIFVLVALTKRSSR